jgi:hypothetical protein
MYLHGMGLRAIARVTEIDHTTIINWVREKGETLPDEGKEEEIPEITEIDKLQTPTHLPFNGRWNAGCPDALWWAAKRINFGFGQWSTIINQVSGYG